MQKIVKSKNPCPFCGKKEWVFWNFSTTTGEWETSAYLFHPIVDLDPEQIWFGWGKSYCWLDECVSCGALIQG